MSTYGWKILVNPNRGNYGSQNKPSSKTTGSGAQKPTSSYGGKIIAVTLNPYLIDQDFAPMGPTEAQFVGTFSTRRHPYSESTLIDNCGALHVVNRVELLDSGTFQPSAWTDSINVGTSSVAVKGRGTRTLKGAINYGNGKLGDLVLLKVAVVEGFHVNIVSEAMLRASGLWVCGQDATLRMGEIDDSLIVRQLERRANLTFFEYKSLSTYPLVPQSNAVMMYPTMKRKVQPHFRKSRDYPRPREDPAWKWHLRGFHIAGSGLVELAKNVRNVKVTKLHRIECSACSVAHMSKQINRLASENRSPRPFFRIAWDLFDFDRAYDASEWLLVIKDEHSGKLWTFALPSRKQVKILRVLQNFDAWVTRQYGLYICVFRHDRERGVFSHFGKTEYEKFTEEKGITIKVTPPHTKEPNGGSERVGQEVILRSITVLEFANLPQDLWPESTQAGAHVYNMSPVQRHDWKSPNEVLLQWFRNYYRHFDPDVIKLITTDLRPDWTGIYVYGYRAYAMKRDREAGSDKKGFKTKPRAHIGYLVGYVASNIYRIWILELKEVIITRNVVFDETSFYNKNSEGDLAIGIQEKRSLVNEIQEPLNQALQDADMIIEGVFEEDDAPRIRQP
jgi:transposase InsO family protein